MSRIALVTSLTILWLMLWGDISPLLVLGGILTALIVISVFPFPPAVWDGSFRPWPFVVLVVRFAWDLVYASIQVAWIAVRPKPLGKSAVIEVELHTRSELLLTLTSELVSLVPGSLLIELDAARGLIWLHVLDGEQDLGKVRDNIVAQERRVIAALGSRAERDTYCTANGKGNL